MKGRDIMSKLGKIMFAVVMIIATVGVVFAFVSFANEGKDEFYNEKIQKTNGVCVGSFTCHSKPNSAVC